MRPKQWVKNVLVFIAPAAAGTLFHHGVLWPTIVAFIGFSLAASGTYLVNDVRDRDSDRQHPKKRFRPIACRRAARQRGSHLCRGAHGRGRGARWLCSHLGAGRRAGDLRHHHVALHGLSQDRAGDRAGLRGRRLRAQSPRWWRCLPYAAQRVVRGGHLLRRPVLGGGQTAGRASGRERRGRRSPRRALSVHEDLSPVCSDPDRHGLGHCLLPLGF